MLRAGSIGSEPATTIGTDEPAERRPTEDCVEAVDFTAENDGGGLDRTADLGIVSDIRGKDDEARVDANFRRSALSRNGFRTEQVLLCFDPDRAIPSLNCHRYSHRQSGVQCGA